PVPQRFWKVRPFYDNKNLQPIDELMALFSAGSNDPAVQSLGKQIDQWRKNPFNPHLIARMRPIAYQNAVVIKYIDNLIAWGDQLFRQDTIEAINEATQLYILASNILGPRPQQIPQRRELKRMTYQELEPMLDKFSNALVGA